MHRDKTIFKSNVLFYFLALSALCLLLSDIWGAWIISVIVNFAPHFMHAIWGWRGESIYFLCDLATITLALLKNRWAFAMGAFTSLLYIQDLPPILQYWHWGWGRIYLSNYAFVSSILLICVASVAGLIMQWWMQFRLKHPKVS